MRFDTPHLVHSLTIVFVRLTDTASDLLASIRNAHNTSPNTAAYSFILRTIPTFCPRTQWGTLPCRGEVDLAQIGAVQVSALSPSGVITNVSAAAIGNTAALGNLFQLFYSAVRLDLGFVLPSNVLTNASAFTAAIDRSSSPSLYRDYLNPANASITYPLTAPDQAVIDTSYECKFKYRKSAAEIFISVSVATASLIASGWAFLMLVASYHAGQAPEGE